MKLLCKYSILFFVFTLCSVELFSKLKEPNARFLFNDGNIEDEISRNEAILVGAYFTEDRFGNPKSAIYLSGHEYSYINLGTSAALKPSVGSVSIWVKIIREVFYGQGYKHNPVILTKNAPRDDYSEAYAIFFDLETQKIMASCSNDSSTAPNVYEMKDFRFGTWYHAVLTYDYNYLSFYIDGKLVGKTLKNFETKFDPLDSVIVGGSANKKNVRYSFGTFDDIEFYDRVLTGQEVAELYRAPNPNKSRVLLNWILVAIFVLGVIAGIYFFIRRRFELALIKEKQRLELANKLLENDLRINRALMNPHFIFNALNALHTHILNKNTDVASDYLVKFSRLIRKILDSNVADTLSLEMEIDLINRYLEIEELRFNDSITYSIIIEEAIPSTAVIPIMMVQPFVENAIWHGLRDKMGDKSITISFSLFQDIYIRCVIEDNGTGRRVKSNNPEKNSLATGFVQHRLELLNKIHSLSCNLEIIDKPNGSGTIVILVMPILNK